MFVRHLNNTFNKGTVLKPQQLLHIVSANITKGGNIAIQVDSPLSASTLLKHPAEVQKVAASAIDRFKPTEEPDLTLDVPWSGVVIHDLPGPQICQALERCTLWQQLRDEGKVDNSAIRGTLKVLCRDEEYPTKEKVSLLVRFEDQQACNRLRKDGVVLFATWFRVSNYQGPKRQSRCSSSPPTMTTNSC
ncbi:hypothetical protein NLJ89_g11231 [Agrocybe chaxingu]|uniref:Uncharacterized protein n=1 Tax=Agrocybe chaxingu TaxID=84603 RepID=A0A9W8MQ66_9AGAR|nr:hypothetical protein NLJ89_g11231 [Agrocybe chaxingu]